jgi:hypothetical protein
MNPPDRWRILTSRDACEPSPGPPAEAPDVDWQSLNPKLVVISSLSSFSRPV